MRAVMPEKYRNLKYSAKKDGANGLFFVPFELGGPILTVIVSDGLGWDHVSVSQPERCPTWPEMCRIKDLFFEPSETVIQFHPAVSEYVNNHPYCLHLWKSQTVVHELPPSFLTGLK